LRGARLRINDITRQLDLLKLPGQRHTYVEHPLTIASQTDPAISLAISRSIKAASVMQIDSEGRRTSTKRLYLDSSMLQQHLRSIRDGRATAFASERAAEVTIFVLSLDTPHPLFVVRLLLIPSRAPLFHQCIQDMHYQAVSLSDMVVAVQSMLYHVFFSLSRFFEIWFRHNRGYFFSQFISIFCRSLSFLF
jgi:hypothetical protein